MLIYNKLFSLLALRGMKRTDLLCIMTAPTLAKLGKGERVNTEILDRICKHLQCQPGDILEYKEG